MIYDSKLGTPDPIFRPSITIGGSFRREADLMGEPGGHLMGIPNPDFVCRRIGGEYYNGVLLLGNFPSRSTIALMISEL